MSLAERAADAREFKLHWAALLGAGLGMAIGVTGVVPYTSGVFLPHLVKAFGWSKGGIGLGQSLQAFGGAAAAPLAGLVVDRVGARLPTLIGLAGFALALFSLSFLGGDIEVFWATMLVIGVCGAAAGPLVFTRVISENFTRRRGLAIGLALSGVGVGAAVYPVALTAVVAASGWRGGYVALAALVGLASPLALLLIRGRQGRATVIADQPRAPWSSILGVGVLWRLMVGFALAAGAVTGYLLHLVPLLREAGLSPAQAAGLQSLIGLSVLASRLSAGAVADLVFAPRVMASLMAGAGIGAAALAGAGAVAALPAVLLFGLALGCEVDLLAFMVARYFPAAAYGRAYGLVYGAAMVAAGLSPAWIGTIADRTGGYAPALWISAIMFTVAAGLFVTAPRFPEAPEPAAA